MPTMATGMPKTIMTTDEPSSMPHRDTVAPMLRQAVALLLLCGNVWAASPVDALLQQGSQKFEDGDVDGALAAFDKAEKLAPKDARPRFMRGSALLKKGDLAGAEKGFRDALA